MVSMMVRSRAVSNITTVAAAAASLWCFLVSCGSLSLSSVHAFSTTTPLRCSPCTHIRRHGLGFFSSSQRRIQHQPQSRSFHNYCPLTLESSNSDAERSDASDDKLFDAKTTIALVGGQSLLIGAAAIAAKFVGTPNYGLGPGIDASLPYVLQGLLWSLPLGLLAIALDLVEDKFPALQEVTKATQSSVLSLLGGTFKPVLGIATALALGAAAGIGEEMLFRGVLQFELGSRLGSEILAVGLTSIVFGALHAVTPLYAGLAALASVYFGWLYLVTGNLVVPIVTHAFYDWAALLYAHWTVANMSDSEQQSLLKWRFGGSSSGSNGGEGEE
jgi:membrane protease YdiL (CAAX protease family)